MIFLSASIPIEARGERFFKTADIIAIRDAVRALSTVVIPRTKLIWGGHPAITPLVRHVMQRLDIHNGDHMTIYQSAFHAAEFIPENDDFDDVIIVPANETKVASINDMRSAMIDKNDFQAGIFIGGMEGVLDEFDLFKQAHPHALLLPVASTGGAARIIYEEKMEDRDERLLNEFAYMSLFKSLLGEILER